MTKHAFARLKHHGYKPSGEDWMGAIPEQWNPCSIRSQFFFRNEKNDPIKTDNILSLSIANGVTPYSEEGRGGNKAKSDLSAYKLAYPDDIVLNSMNVVVGSVGRSKYFGAISPVYYALCARNNTVYVPFYERVFHDQSFQRSLIKYGKGILVKKGENDKLNTIRMKISVDDLKVLLLPHPSYKEQKAIADFLDEKTALIDRAIEIKEKQVALLKERKQILIQNAVTKGLDPSVPMKDSGVDWIGQIPAHWEVKKLKHLARINSDSLPENAPRDLEIEYVDIGNVSFENGVESCHPYTFSDAPSRARRIAKEGDTIVSTVRTYLKAIDYVSSEKSRYIYSTGFAVVSPKAEMFPEFLTRFVGSNAFTNQVDLIAKGVSYPAITSIELGELMIVLPPTEEMQQITQRINESIEMIGTAIGSQLQQIEKLKEYKASLINSAVTGKIKVA